MWLVLFITCPVADPGFPVGGGADLVGGAPTPETTTFEKFVCQNERIWTRRGARARQRPLDPPLMPAIYNKPVIYGH